MSETPDLPCPKCGSPRTEMIYCNSRWVYRELVEAWKVQYGEEKRTKLFPVMPPSHPRYYDGAGREIWCFGPESEHFHRGCLRCEYRWITEDVVTG